VGHVVMPQILRQNALNGILKPVVINPHFMSLERHYSDKWIFICQLSLFDNRQTKCLSVLINNI
jgi:hypothetical protein